MCEEVEGEEDEDGAVGGGGARLLQ